MGLGGVTVRLSGMAEAQTATDNSGQYAFTGLRSGTYSVEISGFDSDEVGFGSLESNATVGVGESKIISFDGTYLRTAGIMGQVSVEGVGLAGVTVTMTGEGEDETDVTDAGGLYAFSKLKAGAYSVAISGYDPDEVEFETTSMNVTIALGETANIPFNGTLLRTSGISGRVSTEGEGRDGVTVTLSGAAEATAMTANGGQYAFAGLAEGTYVVTMMNPNETAYAFETTSATIELGDAESNITNFDGTHTRTASVSGVAYIDEAPADKMYTANEPMLAHAGIPVALQGPGVNDVMVTVTDSTGAYMFSNLMAGDYRVLVNMTPEVAAAITAAGFAYKGDLTGEVVSIAAGGSQSVHLPFGITTQTIAVGARMGYGEHLGVPVAGVELAVYANANMTGMLGEGTTNEMGHTTIDFARAMNTGPGGNDNLVFVNVKVTGHDDLAVSDNSVIEVSYPATARVHVAPAAVTLVNTRANFQFWVKNNETARGGDMGLGGWATEVTMGMDTVPLMVVNAKGDTVNATMPTDTAMASRGRAGLSYVIDPAMLKDGPATFTVMVQDDQSSEMYELSDALVHMHNALAHPAMNTMEMNDLGPIRVTWTTQKLTVGVYRETDDEPGFSNYQSKVDGGDQRPSDDVSEELMVELMTESSRGRLTKYEYKAFDSKGKRTVEVSNPMSFAKGLASFKNLPADEEFTVRFHAGSDRKAVVDAESARNGRDVDTYGGDLEDGTSVGAFGDDGGAGPEVRLCPMSSSSKDDMCSTFGYQWASGSISGKVTRRAAGVSSAAVNLEAITDNHSPDDNTKTSKSAATKGKYSFASVQDGEYWVRTPATATSKADSARVAIYHEEMDDDPDDGITGTPVVETVSFDVTALRLEIKGYVVNDGHEGDLDQIVRGDEAIAGVELELLTIKGKVSSNKKDTTFTSHGTTETDDDGSYSFDDVVEGDSYYVRATSTGEYVAAEASAKDGFSRKVAADEYPAVEEGDFKLPYWDYNAGTTMNTSVEVSNAKGTVKASFVNFALLYVDGSISGRVREASGSPGNITVELIRCETYDAEDEDCSTYDRDNFPTQTTETKKNGTWEFDDLLEGWYEVYVGEAGYLAADIDEDDMIDDDGGMESLEMHTGLLKGKRDLASGNNFYVYDNGLDDDDDMEEIEVEGTTDPDEDPEDLAASANIADQGTNLATAITGMSSDAITFGSKSVSVEPDIHKDATFTATTGAGKTLKKWPVSKGVATVGLDWDETGSSDDEGEATKATEITVTVTAENGYDDHDYTFSASRMNPVGNDLVADDFTVEAPSGSEIAADIGEIDRFTVNVAEAADELTFTVTLQDIDKQELLVEIDGDEVTPSDSKRADGAHEQRYEVELKDAANIIDLTVTSEDEVEQSYQVVVRRDARSGDKTLKALSLSAGTLSPAFTASTTSYTASVGNTVRTVTVTATANDDDASVAQSPTNPVPLSVGTNPITVTVTAEDGTTGAYTVTVTRDAPGVSSDATLGALGLSEGALLSPAFDPAMLKYTASVGNAVDSVDVTATPNHGSANVVQSPVNPVALSVGPNTITLTVTAEDATTTMMYTVTVTRDAVGTSSDANLGTLILSPGTLTPEFDAATTSYTASVANTVESVDVTATASHSSATVAQDPDNPVKLVAGVAKTITVTVTAGDGATKDYTVTVTRAAGGVGSSDADLSGLSLSAGTLTPAFNAATTSYTASVATGISTVTVTPTANDADASVAQSPTNPVPLAVGPTTITVTVTAEDGTTTQAYTVTVTRAAAPTTPGLIVSVEEVTVDEGGDDRPYTVRLATRPSGDVTVAIAVVAHADNTGGTVDHISITRESLTFDETNWNRARTVTISVGEDENESSEIANITHKSPGYIGQDSVVIKVTAKDDDVVAGAAIRVDRRAVGLTEGDEDDGSAVVMVSLAVVPTGTVEVTVVSSAAAAASVSETDLTFTAANWDDEQPFTVTAEEDDDPADTKATVTLAASGGGYGSAEKVEVAVTVDDDEEATISVSDDFGNAEIVEGGNIPYNITLSAPPVVGETVRVNLQVLGLATVTPAQAVFEAPGTTVRITVATLQDSDDEDATFTILHSVDADDDSGYKGAVAPANINVTVKDDEAAGVVVSRTSLSVEEGLTVMYTVRLTKAPAEGETVTVHLAGTGVNLSAGSLVFTADNGTDTQEVTVTGHTDSNSVDDQATVVHTVVSANPDEDGEKDYEGVTASTVRITVTEKEASSS